MIAVNFGNMLSPCLAQQTSALYSARILNWEVKVPAKKPSRVMKLKSEVLQKYSFRFGRYQFNAGSLGDNEKPGTDLLAAIFKTILRVERRKVTDVSIQKFADSREDLKRYMIWVHYRENGQHQVHYSAILTRERNFLMFTWQATNPPKQSALIFRDILESAQYKGSPSKKKKGS